MHPHRTRLKSAALVAAGLIPAAAVLAGASSPSNLADPAPAHVDNVAYEIPRSAPKPAPDQVKPVVATFQATPASVKSGAVPKINFEAYQAAADTMAKKQPRCGIDWRLIAGIGKVESHHANFGDADKKGELRTPIYGPTLNGTLAGNRVINDTDGGKLDGDPVYDRAVGPMQFLPSTWNHYAGDGNGDGKSDPQNLFDAALTTAKYLCDDNLDLRTDAGRTDAVLRYNNSMEYVSNVLGFARGY
ncbi:lytic transglycosylase domain-containing protein [Gordonia hydrophobica]|uniref:Lytic murein transglycosylase n=1 Tax=Gordonia hydrophobica TaxID=40516 RepID=A0ABZ2TZ57_9ACTN|nr:lytic murein transglycosylase [Gordonia hydrophobica]MBM7368943.1 membrane-bound lytic murein transglycosylase B [Gordonia hydrophobica]